MASSSSSPGSLEFATKLRGVAPIFVHRLLYDCLTISETKEFEVFLDKSDASWIILVAPLGSNIHHLNDILFQAFTRMHPKFDDKEKLKTAFDETVYTFRLNYIYVPNKP